MLAPGAAPGRGGGTVPASVPEYGGAGRGAPNTLIQFNLISNLNFLGPGLCDDTNLFPFPANSIYSKFVPRMICVRRTE